MDPVGVPRSALLVLIHSYTFRASERREHATQLFCPQVFVFKEGGSARQPGSNLEGTWKDAALSLQLDELAKLLPP
jgi:hypothetical protein